MIDEGVFRARAVGGALGFTKAGKERVAVELEVIQADGTTGPRITWFGYFTDKTTERTIEALRLMGWRGDDLSDLTGIANNDVSIVVAHEEYEGKVQAKVQWINAPDSVALQNAMSDADAKAFAQRMRATVLAHNRAKAAPRVTGKPEPRTAKRHGPPEPPPHGEADAPPDSDIPF